MSWATKLKMYVLHLVGQLDKSVQMESKELDHSVKISPILRGTSSSNSCLICFPRIIICNFNSANLGENEIALCESFISP